MTFFGYNGDVVQLNLACNVTSEYKPYRCVSGIFIKLDRSNTDVAKFESYLAEYAKVKMQNHNIYTITSYDGSKLYVGAEDQVLEIGSSIIDRKDSGK